MPRGETLQVPAERPAGPANFELVLPWPLAGDQPQAATQLSDGLLHGLKDQTLHGVTGSGKTVTMAQVIADAGRPTLVLAHNKTLAAQLYGEFKEFFPKNAVQYFVSYYDYYQPEAYIARSDTYIEKDSSRNEEIDRMRHAATRSLFERRDVLIVPFVTPREKLLEALKDIEAELALRTKELEEKGRLLEAQRLSQRTRFDLEMMRETGTCAGIENYSRHLARRPAGSRPWTLLDYFPPDFLAFVDESHISIPQVRGMYFGDRSRKEILVDYGFRLPSALDNRPLTFAEFEQRLDQAIYVSATPGPYELEHSSHVVEQIIRPTGLIDTQIEVRETEGQMHDLLAELNTRVERGQRAIVTTLTKKMAEDLADYLREMGIKVQYLHSEIETLQRVEILRDLRLGVYDVVVGVNLLREGIDLPEVTLVAILDADKEGYLRSEGSLIQVIGRAARHVEGRVIMYADRVTASMRAAIDETERRRELQCAYNSEHGIEPQTIVKAIREIGLRLRDVAEGEGRYESTGRAISGRDLGKDELVRLIKDLESQMKQAAKELEFERAAALRDEVVELRGQLVLERGPESIDAAAEPVSTTTRVVRAGMRRGRRGP